MGGWFAPGPPLDPAEALRRMTAADRAAAEDDRRVRAALDAEFGRQDEPRVTSAVLPISGLTFQWRTDGRMRVLDPREDRDADDPDDAVEWEDLDIQDDRSCTGIHETAAGASPRPTWCVWFGTARPGVEVTAWLADRSDVPIVRLGWLWIAEWRSVAQPGFVRIGARTVALGSGRHANHLGEP